MCLYKNRQIWLFLVLVLSIPAFLQAQYKREVPSIPGLTLKQSGESARILGIDLSKIDFQNSYSMEVSSFGNNTVAMGLLKSSFNYVINPQVSVKGYVGLIHSPFSSFAPGNGQSSFSNGLDKDNILYGGEITYRPTENMFFQIGINRIPVSTSYPFNSPANYRMLGY